VAPLYYEQSTNASFIIYMKSAVYTGALLLVVKYIVTQLL